MRTLVPFFQVEDVARALDSTNLNEAGSELNDHEVSSIVLVFSNPSFQLRRTDVTTFCMHLRNQLER